MLLFFVWERLNKLEGKTEKEFGLWKYRGGEKIGSNKTETGKKDPLPSDSKFDVLSGREKHCIDCDGKGCNCGKEQKR